MGCQLGGGMVAHRRIKRGGTRACPVVDHDLQPDGREVVHEGLDQGHTNERDDRRGGAEKDETAIDGYMGGLPQGEDDIPATSQGVGGW